MVEDLNGTEDTELQADVGPTAPAAVIGGVCSRALGHRPRSLDLYNILALGRL